MKKKSDKTTLREAVAIHRRASRDIRKYCPGLFISTILLSTVKAVSPYVTIYFSARLINELASLRRIDVLTGQALTILGVTVVLSLVRSILERRNSAKRTLFYKQYPLIYSEKFLSMDYADSDSQKTRDLFTQVMQNSQWGGWGLSHIYMYLTNGVEAVAGILGAVALTVSLFTLPVPDAAGSLTFLNHPVCHLIVTSLILGITFISPALTNKATSMWSRLAENARFGNRLFGHFNYSLHTNSENDMDVRIYNQLSIAEHYVNTVKVFGSGSQSSKLCKGILGIFSGLSGAVSAILSGVVYVFVCLKAWAGAFGIGSVTQYISAVTTLSGNMSALLKILGHMRANADFLKTTYEFLDIPNNMYQGSLTTEKRNDRQYEIEFKDVSFKYPGSDLWALRHVNMKFKVGNRLAIVGENGSGKSTFIKLLCRLYDPQEGQILLNGIDIRKYNYDDYMSVFSVVFQDFRLISQPLGANVAGSAEYDRSRVIEALNNSGFGDRLAALENGLDTMLYKHLSEDGVEISGGEAQKIAIARALYKDASFIILDEPTAALDPIAEAEIYSKFNDIVGDKTAIYISHRLSSCIFCDEIAVFHEGSVIQRGSHAALLNDYSGKYHELWNAQAQYYASPTQNIRHA